MLRRIRFQNDARPSPGLLDLEVAEAYAARGNKAGRVGEDLLGLLVAAAGEDSVLLDMRERPGLTKPFVVWLGIAQDLLVERVERQCRNVRRKAAGGGHGFLQRARNNSQDCAALALLSTVTHVRWR